MIKKTFWSLIIILVFGFSIICFSSCEITQSSNSEVIPDDDINNSQDNLAPHIHDWELSWTVIKPASCTEAGEQIRYCITDNSHVETQDIPPLGHKPGEWQIDENYHWQICTVCNDIISRQPHEGEICSECGYEKATILFQHNPEYDSYDVKGCKGIIKNLEIPSEHNGKPVTYIQAYAFANNPDIKTVIIPDSVIGIGACAFANCTNLKKIKIGKGVQSINSAAFCPCNNLSHIDICDIGAWCSIDFASIAANPLYNPNAQNYMERNLYLNDVLLSNVNLATSNVQQIKQYAFAYCVSIQSVVLPQNLTSIENDAFLGCKSIQSIFIPESVEHIGDGAFCDCERLQTIKLQSDSMQIGSKVFSGTAFWKDRNNWVNGLLYLNNYLLEASENFNGNLRIKDGTVSVCGGAFLNCNNLMAVSFPTSLHSIQHEAFYGTGLTEVTIPDTVDYIGLGAFNNCAIQRLTLPFIGERENSEENNFIGFIFGTESYNIIPVLEAKSLQSVTVTGKGVIADYAFYGYTELRFVELSDNISAIGNYAFVECKNLTKIIIGSNVKSIGRKAFTGCSHLESVFYKGQPLEWNEIDIESDTTLVSTKRYYYSETTPTENQIKIAKNWWHYSNGLPILW